MQTDETTDFPGDADSAIIDERQQFIFRIEQPLFLTDVKKLPHRNDNL